VYLQLKKNGLCPKCAALGGTIASRCSSLSRCFQRSNPARNGRANRPPNPAQNPLLIPAPKSYNRSDMQLASSRALREPPPAAMRLGGEKPHQGLSSKKPASHRGLNRCKSMTALWASQSWRPESVPGATVFRKYDPSAGRWLSPDPLGWGAVSPADPQSLDRYAYVENQPMNEIDPSGQAACLVSIGGMWFGYDSGNDPCAPGFKAYQTDPQTVTSNANSDSCSDSNPAACAPPSNLGGGSIPGGASGSGAGSGGGAPNNPASSAPPNVCQAIVFGQMLGQMNTSVSTANNNIKNGFASRLGKRVLAIAIGAAATGNLPAAGGALTAYGAAEGANILWQVPGVVSGVYQAGSQAVKDAKSCGGGS